jgi:membrane-associated phospholipid phosphatase
VTQTATDALLTTVAWPGQPPRGRILPGLLAASVGLIAGPRAAVWQLAAWGVLPLGGAAKRIVNRPRPMPGRLNPMGGMSQDPSFPSTHVSEYVATLGLASWILWRRRSPVAVPIAVVAAGCIGLIGPSRVRTGDHRWSDVAGGYLLGTGYLATLVALARRDRKLAPAKQSRAATSAVSRPRSGRPQPTTLAGSQRTGAQASPAMRAEPDAKTSAMR